MIHLSEAVARRSVGKYTDLDNFPSEPDITKIKAFLDGNGFIDYTKKGALTDIGLMARCGKEHSRGYKLGPCEDGEGGTWWIMFGDARKTYMCRDKNHYDKSFDRFGDRFRITFGRGMRDSWTPNSYDEFRKKAVEYLKLGEVNEAVAKRTAGKYGSYGSYALDTKEGAINYLKNNGFVDIGKKGTVYKTEKCFDMGVPLWYQVGPYTVGNTQWIEFGDSEHAYLVRTEKERDSTVAFSRTDRSGGYARFTNIDELMNDAIKTLGLQ